MNYAQQWQNALKDLTPIKTADICTALIIFLLFSLRVIWYVVFLSKFVPIFCLKIIWWLKHETIKKIRVKALCYQTPCLVIMYLPHKKKQFLLPFTRSVTRSQSEKCPSQFPEMFPCVFKCRVLSNESKDIESTMMITGMKENSSKSSQWRGWNQRVDWYFFFKNKLNY